MEQIKPIRKRIRLEGYDYSENGAYFITICTKDRQKLFWSVGANCVRPNEESPLSDIGRIVDSELRKLNSIYETVRLDKYCIMPEHIHMIILIDKETGGRTQFAPTISRVVKQFKGSVSKQVGKSIWQKSFVDRVIRDEQMNLNIWKYIDENPLNPDEDE